MKSVHKFEASLGYIVSFRLARVKRCLKKQNKTQTKNKKTTRSWAWWRTPLMSARGRHRRQRQVHLGELVNQPGLYSKTLSHRTKRQKRKQMVYELFKGWVSLFKLIFVFFFWV